MLWRFADSGYRLPGEEGARVAVERVRIEREHAMQVWGRLLRAHSQLTRDFNAQLQAGHGLSVSDLEVLNQLSSAPEGRMRRTDLAAATRLTPSGVTRLLEGLQRAGLVRDEHCPSDARVVYACITEEGTAVLRCAIAGHVQELQALLSERYDGEEVAHLVELLGRLPGATEHEERCPSVT
jgi:DNA-binding MarR family transcriptional regulator